MVYLSNVLFQYSHAFHVCHATWWWTCELEILGKNRLWSYNNNGEWCLLFTWWNTALNIVIWWHSSIYNNPSTQIETIVSWQWRDNKKCNVCRFRLHFLCVFAKAIKGLKWTGAYKLSCSKNWLKNPNLKCSALYNLCVHNTCIFELQNLNLCLSAGVLALNAWHVIMTMHWYCCLVCV